MEEAESIVTPQKPKATGKGKGKKAKATPVDGASAARGLLEMVELFAVARFGPQAAFSLSERFFIEAPLGRLIERYGNVAEQYSALIDPALVLAGGALYAVRLAGMAQNAQNKPQKAPPMGTSGSRNETASVEGLPITERPSPENDPIIPSATDEIANLVGNALLR